MHLQLSTLAIAASVLAHPAVALSAQDIPTDQPVSDLLASAQSYLSQGLTSEALPYFDAAITRDPSNYLSVFKRATTYLSLGRTAQATDDYNKVLKLKPGFEGAHLQLAKIKAKVADWAGARSEYLRANRSEDGPEIAELDEAFGAAKLADEAEKAGEWEQCVTNAGVAIIVATRSPTLRESRAHCRFERGEIEEGMGDLQHVLHLKPGDITPHVLISATSFYGLGDLDNGLSQVKKCLHSDPDSKVCKALHKQEKAVQKGYKKAVGQLQKGQPTTAGRTLVGTSEDQGLLGTIQAQVERLRSDGHIPPKARFRLYEELIELTCQAYFEVSCGPYFYSKHYWYWIFPLRFCLLCLRMSS